MLDQVADGGRTLRQHLANVSCYLGMWPLPRRGGGVTRMAPAGDVANWTLCTC